MTDDDRKGPLDSLKDKAARAMARKSLEKAGDGLLDGIERFLFGQVGAAEEVLEKERSRGSALDRVREEAGGTDDDDDGGEVQDAPAETPRERAKRRRERAEAELAKLKRALDEESDDAREETADRGEGAPESPPETEPTTSPPLDDTPKTRRRKTKRTL